MFKGERVRELRAERNLTLGELAGKGGISLSYLSELERGSKKPSLATIEKLSAALNVSPREFIEQKKTEGIILGERIRMYREKKKLSLEKLAEVSEISYSYLCGIERGLVSPSLRCLRKIAAGLDVSLSDLSGTGAALGAKLMQIREEQGLNQSQLARKAGLSPGLIGQIERNKVQPSLQTIEKISSALNITPCYFIAEEEGLQELLRLLDPAIRTLLLEKKVQTVLRMLRQCNEKELRLILDFIKLLKQANLCGNN